MVTNDGHANGGPGRLVQGCGDDEGRQHGGPYQKDERSRMWKIFQVHSLYSSFTMRIFSTCGNGRPEGEDDDVVAGRMTVSPPE
jgi:hypothetical protein